MRLSLHARLLLAASLVLAGFLGLTGVALEEAFRASSEEALRERMQGHVYALLAAADEDAEGHLKLPYLLSDPRFNQPGSGYYARVDTGDGRLVWRSASTTGSEFGFFNPETPGQFAFRRLADGGELGLFVINYGIVWEFNDGTEQSYVFSAAEDLAPFERLMSDFRRTLWTWLGGGAVVLLLAQVGVLGWSLKPLRRVADELKRVEAGERELLGLDYPRELRALTRNINSLIQHSQAQQARYRHSMDDLAHSLKTPLAVLQGAAEKGSTGDDSLIAAVEEQVGRMNEIVRYQLGRAVSSGRSTLVKPIALGALVERIGRSLSKVYRDKDVVYRMELTPDTAFPGEEGDLMELFGNLLDNAWKHCRSEVRVAAERAAGAGGRPGLRLHVEDDGLGIPEHQVELVLQRGKRADESKPGQGIGLAVADEIVRLYGGRLEIGRSGLGGADCRVWLPGASS